MSTAERPGVLSRLSANSLGPLVRLVLDDPTAQVGSWEARSIYAPVNLTTAGVYRFDGQATLGHGRSTSWSLVLKIARSPAGVSDDQLQGEREVLAYRSGLLDELFGVRAATCYAIEEPGDGHSWLWLEDLGERPERAWSLTDYATAARDLGRMAGAYAAGRPLPEHSWLDRSGFVRRRASDQDTFGRLAEVQDHPYVRRGSPADVVARQRVLYAEQPILLEALSLLPQTLCHRDPIPRNVSVRVGKGGGLETVAFDWANVGIGPLGRDLASLVPAGAHSGHVEPARLRDVDETAFPAYLLGVRDAGWSGDEALVRFGYCASAAMRYGLLILGVAALDEKRRDGLVRSFGLPLEELLDVFAEEQRYLMDLVDEARTLLPLLPHN